MRIAILGAKSIVAVCLTATLNSANVQASGQTPPQAAIRWETSFRAAVSRAQRERKPVLHFQLFGKLTDALC